MCLSYIARGVVGVLNRVVKGFEGGDLDDFC